MLKTSVEVKTPSVQRLLNLWAQRYLTELSSVSQNDSAKYSSMLAAASPEGRAATVAKLKDNILDVNCQMAWIQTKTLYGYIPNILDLNEARRITQFSLRVYRKLLEIYQQQSVLGIPAVEELAYGLEPILMIFQEQHIVSKDWRALGFMTTQLNFSNSLILRKLAPAEKVLLAPYLQFVEEQVAMPWQRVCAAAAKYELDSPVFILVEQMLSAVGEIAQAAYQRLVELFPHHRSRRGGLNDLSITHSCLRDLVMFQAYILLCFLEESLTPIEVELLPLCVMVVEGVDIKWEMTEKWCQVLAWEIEIRLNPEQSSLLLPYVHQMQQLFFAHRERLGFQDC
ncbi:hypothetical protein [Iningainema tapete]|uniref:Uncharacterized protein n=1 Tax=Iningainema tapete BLCC-T55 TaxID=2748662 RepID=A0A8J6XPT3_9CYAN|nr:hypothetical protein [Iningainema tapete]MBD2775924.1 hypothetical protein [Iningainema tapete BLCC-T55]